MKFSNKKLLLVPFLCSIVYTLIVLFEPPSFFNITIVWGNIFPLGIFCSFISFSFFNSLYSNVGKTKRFTLIALFYIIVALFLAYAFNSIKMNIFLFVFKKIGAINNLVHTITLFSPYFLIIIASVHLYFLKLVTKAEKEQLTQQSLESQLNYQQLKNQLSPHFLFNNINVLTSLIEENPRKAVRFSENLSHIYRYFLEQEKQDVVLVKEEIKFAKSYLELLKDRFEVGLIFSMNINKKLNEKYIVATILQQVLENIVKHNTINEIDIVEVKITSKENYLIIENNKNPKIETEQNSKKGIENIKKRVAFFTDEKVIIKSTKESFIIELPILNTI